MAIIAKNTSSSKCKVKITEEMRWRERVCQYAKKYGVTKAARHYHTNRSFIYRLLDKYDGNVRSLALGSRRPHSHPNQQTTEEKQLIMDVHRRYKRDGLAEVYVQLQERGYMRSFMSMMRVIRKLAPKSTKTAYKTSKKHVEVRGQFPGDKVQVDIKYVPDHCICFPTYGVRYYQITAIDEYTRKRILTIVDEKSTYHTSLYVKTLEERFGFKIHTIQTDNGPEFTNDLGLTNRLSLFDQTLSELNINHRLTAPYSPWQNGKVERSHRIDNELFYNKVRFYSREDMERKVARWNTRYNNIRRQVLNFMSPNQVMLQYYQATNTDAIS